MTCCGIDNDEKSGKGKPCRAVMGVWFAKVFVRMRLQKD